MTVVEVEYKPEYVDGLNVPGFVTLLVREDLMEFSYGSGLLAEIQMRFE